MRYSVILGVALSVSVLAGTFVGAHVPDHRLAVKDGPQIVAALFVNATCHAVLDPAFRDDYQRTVGALRAKAIAAGASFHTVGISVDPDVGVGRETLKLFGRFDEISIGAGWLNLDAALLLASRSRGGEAVPQMVVFSRAVSLDSGYVRPTVPHILFRLIGPGEFRALPIGIDSMLALAIRDPNGQSKAQEPPR